jgi:diguanylate cyclase (GGDEF)-like protein
LRALEGGVKNFDSLMIFRRDGSLAFSFGTGDEEIYEPSDLAGHQDWLLSKDKSHLHWLTRTSIWLGEEGQGTMYLLRPIENDTMGRLASPDVDVALLVNGAAVSSSRGTDGVGEHVDVDALHPTGTGGALVDQYAIPLADGEGLPMHLLVRRNFVDAITPPAIVMTVIGLVAAFALGLWLVLGRWLQQVVRRISTLYLASKKFSNLHQVSDGMRRLLEPAMQQQDEIGVVAGASLAMMDSVHQHQEESRIYLQTLDMLEEGVVELDRDGKLLRAGGGWKRLTGGGGGATVYHGVHAEDKGLLSSQLQSLFSGEKSQVGGRLRFSAGSNEYTWIEYRLIAPTSDPDSIKSVRGVMRDVTQLYQTEKRIIQMALHDALTGLPNRILFEDRCEHALGVAKRQGGKVVLGFIDLDHFKNINDTFGHKIGDQMLIAVANVLKQQLRSGDTLARWGGDEFVVLLTDLQAIDDARQVAQKLIEACAYPVALGNEKFNFTLSMGFAMYPDDADNMETLLSQADRTMFHAKDQGRNNSQFFCDMSNKGFSKKEVYIQNRLVAAINNGQIQTWFQPLLEAKTRRIIGVEALARWHDADYGWVSPATFIPMAENIGMIMELSQQVWVETLRQGRRWRDKGYDLKLAVNISRRQLFMPSFSTSLLEALGEFEIPASSIVLEITESIANVDIEHTGKRLKELADLGFILSIDDFGTGYSSLSVLHDMPVSEIKIDISFVRRALEAQGSELIQAILHMADAFNLTTVAEGVEDEETAQLLKNHGVQYMQGYLFGKPMPAAEMDELLRGM